jgi:hypothetical protein
MRPSGDAAHHASDGADIGPIGAAECVPIARAGSMKMETGLATSPVRT